MKVIVGLGNPGHTYHDTRHNVGFVVIEALGQRHQVRMDQRLVNPADQRPACVCGDYQEGQETVRLLMPLTMMNESGEALRVVSVNPNDLLLVCDDVNLPLGAIRLRPHGGPGGHHGLQSCLDVLQTEAVPRLRVGVGISELPKDLRAFVLAPFHSDERPLMKDAIAQAVDACEVWSKEGIEVAMNRYNRTQDAP